jgi:hypothetical protein
LAITIREIDMKQSERKLPFALTVISAGLLAAGTAWGAGMDQGSGSMGSEGAMGSQGQMQGEHPTFSDLDLNQDGQISKEEANSVEELANNMDQADTDGNGSISQSEFSAFEVQQGWTAPGDMQQQQDQGTTPGGEMQQQEEPMGGSGSME